MRNTTNKKAIKLSKSVVDMKEVNAVRHVMLEVGYFGMGGEVKAFESELKKFLRTKGEVACVNTGTSALHLAVAAVTKPGDEVLVQSLTYLSDFQAIRAAGAVPVACEIDPKNVTIDLKDAERKLTRKTKAIIPVHYAGDPGDLTKIYTFARKHRLRVIEDAAHAFGTVHKGKLVGSFGDIVCFSFDPIKNITSGDGGAVVTADKRVLRYVRDARLLGVMGDSEKRYKGERSWEFDVVRQGYRYHMTNISAAIGRTQLKKFGKFKKKRQSLSKRYYRLLANANGIVLFKTDYRSVVPHIYPIRVLGGLRDALREHLAKQGIETGIHYYPSHLLSYFRKRGVAFPVTEQIYSELLSLPLHPDVTKDEQDRVIRAITTFFQWNKKRPR